MSPNICGKIFYQVMKPRVEYHPAAKREIVASKNWYDKQSEGLGLEFLLEVKKSEKKVIENPKMYPFYEGETQRFLLDRFPFSLIYLFTEGIIQVVAIAHNSRKPKYWITRIE